jgi:hypothetical protein
MTHHAAAPSRPASIHHWMLAVALCACVLTPSDFHGQSGQGAEPSTERRPFAVVAMPSGPMRTAELPWSISTSTEGRVNTWRNEPAVPQSRLDGVPGASDIGARTGQIQSPAVRAPWVAPLSSLVIPGSGQALLRQQRSVAYLVAEAFLVIRSWRSYRDDQDARDRYRALAADVARAGFGSVRPDGPWEYYEEMEKYESSGRFDAGSGGVLVPEPDASTFNGKQWELAREQFWSDPAVPPPQDSPEYKRALDYYRSRAVQGSFQWSWRDHQLEHTAFRETIDESNKSNQRYVTAIGFVAVNHLASLIDAYVTVRLRRYGGAGLSAASVNTKVLPMGPSGDRGYGMALGVTIPVSGVR